MFQDVELMLQDVELVLQDVELVLRDVEDKMPSKEKTFSIHSNKKLKILKRKERNQNDEP